MILNSETVYSRYINLDHRTDRRFRMEETIKKAGINAERFRAIPYKELNLSNPKYQVMLNRTPGAAGCYESQLCVMKDALSEGKHALVMEDDLHISDDYSERLAIINNFIETNDWNIIWGGGTYHLNPPYWHRKDHNPELTTCNCELGRDAEPTSNPRIVRTYGCFSTYFYFVNVNSLPKVIKMLEDSMKTSIGIDFSMITFQPQLKTFAFVPGMVRQYSNQSDIGNGITEFENFKMLGGHWYADNMNDFNPETIKW